MAWEWVPMWVVCYYQVSGFFNCGGGMGQNNRRAWSPHGPVCYLYTHIHEYENGDCLLLEAYCRRPATLDAFKLWPFNYSSGPMGAAHFPGI